MPLCLIKAGPYANQFIMIGADYADAAESDGWATKVKDESSYPFPMEGAPDRAEPDAQSYKDWKEAGYPPGTYGDLIEAPTISALDPTSSNVGEAVTITVTGTGFLAGSVAYVDATAAQTTYVSATEIKANLSASETTAIGAKEVAVCIGNGAKMSNVINYTLSEVTPPPEE